MDNRFRILIADDEPEIVKGVAEYFSHLHPIQCLNLRASKAAIEKYNHEISIIISDINFNGRPDGISIYAYSRDKLGMIPFLFHSGSTNLIPDSIFTDPFVTVFKKPESLRTIESSIQGFLKMKKIS